MTFPEIETVAIVGAGPGGLASLYEFLHLNKDGSSTVGSAPSADPKFAVTVFEQKSSAGGIWAPSEEADLPVPPQHLLDTDRYNEPDVIHPKVPIPEEVRADGSAATYNSPYVTQSKQLDRELEWKRSGVYPDLFTNIPSRFIRFSYQDNEPEYNDKKRAIYPFLTQKELASRFTNFIAKEQLSKHIRYNTRVEEVTKDQARGKWIITVRETNEKAGTESWYKQEFDAVVVANGHYTVPNFPRLKGLAEFNRKNPGVLIHAKSYRDSNIFRGKRVLVVGGGISAANLVQYIFPLASETVITRRGPHLVFPWIDSGLESPGIVTKPPIQEFQDDGSVVFTDGSVADKFDVVLLTTGYHYHYPFLDNYLKVVDPSNLSRVAGLYQQTFSIDDPTLAIAGVAVSAINFHTIEASAAAIAGVWSGAKQLPPREEQQKWEADRVAALGDNLFFHYYPYATVEADYIAQLHAYAAHGRPSPFVEDGKYVADVGVGLDYLEQLFYKLKEGKLTIEETK
ncbi:hypothetical protein CAAN3_04S01662 [[Candida] anglica]